jgi:hypothetical protein
VFLVLVLSIVLVTIATRSRRRTYIHNGSESDYSH